MKVEPIVKKETSTIASGVLVLSMVMLAVYAFLNKLSYQVILGTLLGILAAVGNFFLMALSVQKSTEKMQGVVVPEEAPGEDDAEKEKYEDKQLATPEAASVKKFMKASYMLRMLMLVIVIILAVTIKIFDPIPCLIVLLFPRLVIFAVQIIRNKRGANAQ